METNKSILDDSTIRNRGKMRHCDLSRKSTWIIIIAMIVVVIITVAVYCLEKNWTATGTVCMAGIAGIGIIYSSITVSLMKEETRPYVFVDFILDEDAPVLIDVELNNCGKGSAIDVKVKVIAPPNENEMLEKGAIFQRISDMSIFKNKIQYLPPDRSHIVRYGAGYMINSYLPFQYTFEIEYKDTYGKQYADEITIEPMHLMSCSSSDKKIHKLLGDIDSELKNINEDFRKLDSSVRLMSGETKLCPICKEYSIGLNYDCCPLCAEKQFSAE